MMKKLFYLTVLALMPMFFTACSDDDEPTGVGDVETLYGTWQQTSGYAFEDGAKHHDKSVSADEAEYLRFNEDGTCLIHGGEDGHFYNDGSYSFSFNQEDKVLRIGSNTFAVEVLSGGTLKLRDDYNDDEYVMITYKKVSDSVWENL